MNDTTKAAAKTKPARALIDLPQFDAKCGDLCEVPAEEVAGLKKQGHIDDHPDAVAYAKREAAKRAAADDTGTEE